ncbi:unnamed protein product [Clonostachys rhizophaga]|uniref:Uncharacterized protein n=1 Tax=Clonostachys rhizophaga TaxID=160324 RepID=A0A9N9V114_9HYPO|nr:unnamed protein product [Clonostachys rhizophaga]
MRGDWDAMGFRFVHLEVHMAWIPATQDPENLLSLVQSWLLSRAVEPNHGSVLTLRLGRQLAETAGLLPSDTTGVPIASPKPLIARGKGSTAIAHRSSHQGPVPAIGRLSFVRPVSPMSMT